MTHAILTAGGSTPDIGRLPTSPMDGEKDLFREQYNALVSIGGGGRSTASIRSWMFCYLRSQKAAKRSTSVNWCAK